MEPLTTDRYDDVADSNDLVLLDFFATWCSPCKALEGALKEIEPKYEGRLIIYKINVDEEMDLAVQFSVSALPTIVLCRGGEVLEKRIGMSSASDLENWLDTNLNQEATEDSEE